MYELLRFQDASHQKAVQVRGAAAEASLASWQIRPYSVVKLARVNTGK